MLPQTRDNWYILKICFPTSIETGHYRESGVQLSVAIETEAYYGDPATAVVTNFSESLGKSRVMEGYIR